MIIDKNVSTPLYQQVKDYLERKIVINEWPVGYRLPPEKKLAANFGVSNITVKRAIHELVSEGLLERYSGKGTFVVKKKDRDISTLISLKSESLDEDGDYPHKIIEFKKEETGERYADMFDIKPTDLIYSMTRVKTDGHNPLVLEYSYIPCYQFKESLDPTDFEENLIYDVLVKKYGIKLTKAKVYFSTMVAGEHEQSMLDVSKGQKLFIIDRQTITQEQRVVEYSRFIMEQDQSKFFLEIQV
ncbi:MAG TPA: GntR family transcriptional regulator [Bacillota bacterium]|nr:GntR family transcriptional regulator [Bacillota bacterium]